MKKITIILLLWVCADFVSAQYYVERQIQGVGQWKYYAPFQKAISVAKKNELIYCASRFGIFTYNIQTKEIETITKTDGLSDIEISTIAYYEPLDILFVAYKNSNIDIIQNNTIINLNDIKRTAIIGEKTIHNIYFHQDKAYLSCSFGIVVYDLKKLEVKDTYSALGADGNPKQAYSSLIKNDTLFVATEEGIMAGKVDATVNLLDFNNWLRFTETAGIKMKTITQAGSILYAMTDSAQVYENASGVWQTISIFPDAVRVIKGIGNKLAALDENKIMFYENSELTTISVQNLNFPNDIIADENFYWIADEGTGLIKLQNGATETFRPDGPALDKIFRIRFSNENLYVTSGAYISTFSSVRQPYMVNILNFREWYLDGSWEDTSLTDFSDVVDIQERKSGEKFYASSGYGLLQKNASGFKVYDKTNSPLLNVPTYPIKGFTRITSLQLDADENLWMTNHGVSTGDSSIHVLKTDGEWESFRFPGIAESNYPEKIIIDNIGNKWVSLSKSSTGDGILVFNNETGEKRRLTTGLNSGNLPDTKIYDMAVDKRGYVWLATRNGVAYFSNPATIFEGGESNDASQPIYEGRPLLESEFVKAIEIDGGDRKWLGTSNGLWLMDEYGTQEILNFNIDNSPLPTNNINDIALHPLTGEVFIATDLGLISYRSDATTAKRNCESNIRVYPNPVEPGFNGKVGINGVSDDAQIKILDMWGNMIYEMKANGGMASWDLRDYNGVRANSGVYTILISGNNHKNSCTAQIAIIN